MSPSRLIGLAGLAAGLLATTVALAGPVAAQDATVEDSRVVVAVIDSGINPYHDAFQRETPSVTQAVLDEFGIDEAHVLSLTRTGDPAADFAADADLWASIVDGERYWFSGTNIIASANGQAGDGDPSTLPILPDDDGDAHGTGVAGSVVDANPEAIVWFLEDVTTATETAAFTDPAVDIVTTSYGFPGSIPLPFHLEDSFTGVVELGKIHTGASDNSPALSPFDSTSGPWWVWAIAGFHEGSSGGDEALSGNVVDFVSDFTQLLPRCSICQEERRSYSGTSFSTPRTAGTASKVILDARRAHGHLGGIVIGDDGVARMVDTPSASITNWQIRRAMEEAAYVPTSADFEPGGVFDDLTTVPVNDAAPWLQVGWGLISPDPELGVIDEALARLGVAGTATRSQTAASCAYNEGQRDARFVYWNNVAIESESFAYADDDPTLRCGDDPGAPPPVVPEIPVPAVLVLAGGAALAVASRRRRVAAGATA